MDLTIIFPVLVFVINSHTIYGQVLSCSFKNDDYYDYICDLAITNPEGFNNFTGIDGSHLEGKTNDDVRRIDRAFGSNSTNVPSIICETFKNADFIKLWTSQIQNIDENSFKNCRKLEYLDLQQNKITNIDEKSFDENLALIYLLLNDNHLTTLPDGIFDSLQNLEILYLNTNQIKDLRVEWFEKLGNLKKSSDV